MSGSRIFLIQDFRDLLIGQMDAARCVGRHERERYSFAARSDVNPRLGAHSHRHRSPLGKSHGTVEHDDAILNVAGNVHVRIVRPPPLSVNR